MLRLVRSFSFFSILVFVTLTATAAEIQPVKYVFLFIGDGMAPPQQQMAEEYVKKTAKENENRGLRINAMPYQATTTTRSANAAVTESAAAGTAIACGVKTNNNVLGLDPKGERLESIAELAKKNGRKVGIISSVTINHATPAAFYAHNVSRNNEYEIGLDMIKSGFDYFGGGGIAQHDRKGTSIYTLAQEAGYTVCRTEDEIKALKPGVGKVIALGSKEALYYALDIRNVPLDLPLLRQQRLTDYTKQAIELLDNPNGFFIMIEGGKIDWACHNNDAGAAILDIIEFDDAVELAFEFAKSKPGEVLIVVTGDHETGGLSLAPQNHVKLLSRQHLSFDHIVALTEERVKHVPDPILEGKMKDFFDAMIEKEVNEGRIDANKMAARREIAAKQTDDEKNMRLLAEMCGLVFSETEEWQPGNLVLTPAEVKELETSFEVSKKAILDNRGAKDAFAKTAIRILNKKAGITWKSGDHTALPVQTSTWGNQAEEIAKNIKDNTDIGKLLKQAVLAMP
jgi:alkaline phosphatase